MSTLSQKEYLNQQYGDDKNLSARIKIHSKHSVNKYGFGNWLFDRYVFKEGFRILELGCGNGSQWENRLTGLPRSSRLILSDISDGMVETVLRKFSSADNVEVRRIDIQSISYPDSDFNAVIANHMLYHVPDIDRALSEVRRVLRSGGTFYATTIGENGIGPYLHRELSRIDPRCNAFDEIISFSLQNGADILRRYFKDVRRIDYEDSLRITDTRDLIDWIESGTIGMFTEKEYAGMFEYFESIRIRDGFIEIPKENGIFIAVKSG